MNSNNEISKDQLVDEELDDSDANNLESNSEDLSQSVSSGNKGNNVDSSNFDTTVSDTNDDVTDNNDVGNSPEQSAPPKDPVNPSINENDQQADINPNAQLTYKEYISMSSTEQKAYYDSYEDFMDFFAWYNAAKAKYDAENESIEIQDGEINIGDIIEK